MAVTKTMKTVTIKPPKAVLKAMKAKKAAEEPKGRELKRNGSDEIKDLISSIRVPRKVTSALKKKQAEEKKSAAEEKKATAEQKKMAKKAAKAAEKSESSGTDGAQRTAEKKGAAVKAAKKTEAEKKPIQQVATAQAPKKDSIEVAILVGARLRQAAARLEARREERRALSGRSPKKAVNAADHIKAAKVAKQAAKADAVEDKTEARPEGPKRPVGGAWGVFLQEQRAEIVKSLPEGCNKITDVAKKAKELYKALSEAQLKRLKEQFDVKTEAYKKEVANWEKACIAAGHPVETTPSKKRKMDNSTPTKVSAENLGPLDPDALREARGLGYKHEEAFRSLAATARLIDNKVPHAKIVRALRASGGHEKKAFAALANC